MNRLTGKGLCVVGWVLLLLLPYHLLAGGTPKPGQGKGVAHPKTIIGALLQRQPGKPWQIAVEKDGIVPGSELVALPECRLLSANGAIEVALLADVGQRGPFPVLEAGVQLHDPGQFDLDITLQRGLLVLANRKTNGTAKVRLRFANQSWDLTLHDPGTRVGMELYARHAPEAGRDLDSKHDPLVNFVLLVVEGETLVEMGGRGYGLKAPPGQALVVWDNVAAVPQVQRLEKLPEGVTPLTDKEKKLVEQIGTCVSCLATEPVGKVMDRLIRTDKILDRKVGVTLMGAVDDLPRLVEVLAGHKDATSPQAG